MCKNCIYANEYGDCTYLGPECIQEAARKEERRLQEGNLYEWEKASIAAGQPFLLRFHAGMEWIFDLVERKIIYTGPARSGAR